MEADNYLHLFSFDVDIVKHDHLSKRLQSVGRICRIYCLCRILASYSYFFKVWKCKDHFPGNIARQQSQNTRTS